MFLLITGMALLVLGLFSGVVLVLAPLGLTSWTADLTLWVLFPLFSIAGFALFVIGAKGTQIRGLSTVVSGLLLLLALASATGLVLSAAGVTPAVGNTWPLWYVLLVAGVLGAVGAASRRDPSGGE